MSKQNNNSGTGNQPCAAFASTDCPSCGGFVALSGSGLPGQQVQLTGTCPNGHDVFFNTAIPNN